MRQDKDAMAMHKNGNNNNRKGSCFCRIIISPGAEQADCIALLGLTWRRGATCKDKHKLFMEYESWPVNLVWPPPQDDGELCFTLLG